MDVTWLQKNHDGYPDGLTDCLQNDAPTRLAIIGSPGILRQKMTGLLCSESCPGRLILRTYDYITSLRDKEMAVISGFHSPMEQECLRLLLRGTGEVVICPARNIENMRIRREWKQPLEEGRLLLLSPFAQNHRRVTKELAEERNVLVAALADRICVPYARTCGKIETLCHRIASWKKKIVTFEIEENANLISLGAEKMCF